LRQSLLRADSSTTKTDGLQTDARSGARRRAVALAVAWADEPPETLASLGARRSPIRLHARVVAAESWLYHHRTAVSIALSLDHAGAQTTRPGDQASTSLPWRSHLDPHSLLREINFSTPVGAPMEHDLALPRTPHRARATARLATQPPAHVYFVTMATFTYLGPSFAVLLFARVDDLGVAWLRIVSAAVILAAWRRPWRTGGCA
jgi:hypothetical protein